MLRCSPFQGRLRLLWGQQGNIVQGQGPCCPVAEPLTCRTVPRGAQDATGTQALAGAERSMAATMHSAVPLEQWASS